MNFNKNDVKHGIDNAATHLKETVDKITERTSESREKASEKAREILRKTGDELIEQGHKLKNAASGQSAPQPADSGS